MLTCPRFVEAGGRHPKLLYDPEYNSQVIPRRQNFREFLPIISFSIFFLCPFCRCALRLGGDDTDVSFSAGHAIVFPSLSSPGSHESLHCSLKKDTLLSKAEGQQLSMV